MVLVICAVHEVSTMLFGEGEGWPLEVKEGIEVVGKSVSMIRKLFLGELEVLASLRIRGWVVRVMLSKMKASS